MDYQREAHEEYQKAYSIAMRNQLKDKKQRVAPYPSILDAILNESMISCRQDLGVMDIPTNLIIGVSEYSDVLLKYTKDFLPLADPNSQIAMLWRHAYQALKGREDSKEISCLEYLGKFYVVDGLQEVSVAKYSGTYQIRSHVTRVLPVKTESRVVEHYYDFLIQFDLTNLYQLQFTQPGYFEKLQSALNKQASAEWTDTDRSKFLMHWPKIERAFQKSFDNCLNITSADALVVLLAVLIMASIVSIFAVIFVMPLVEQWPYRLNLSMDHVKVVFADAALKWVYGNSLLAAFLTALIGTIVVYACALVSARHNPYRKFGRLPDAIALITNTIPGMVLGVAYLMRFNGTVLHNSFAVLVICNIVHFFSSPYLMMKGSLEKLNASWETTARLMGDSWLQTVMRIITPNAVSTLLETFQYFFVNSMVTVSAVIFLVSTKTMVITAKIKELQHFASFNEIFVLSILILLTNLLVKGVVKILTVKATKKG